jgi:peptide/nickel transport system substrate-binding protein
LSTSGRAVFVPNPSYTGPDKPKLAHFIESPFTSSAAKFDVLSSGHKAIDFGYIPVTDLGQKGRIESLGYTVQSWTSFGFNYFVENYNNPTYGPVFKQAYFRQAFQHLIDQPAWIKSFLQNYAVPSYSPIPLAPSNPFADSDSRNNLYPYSITKAKSLLESHGWKMVNGVMTCETPGTTSNQCGAGISKGLALTLNLQYASGTQALAQEMEALQSAAAKVGIKVNLSEAPFNTVEINATPCSGSSCTWQMENWGGGWVYSPDNYPTGGEIFATGAASNNGSWNDSTTNTLINETHTSSNAQQALDAYQNYMARALPVVFTPSPVYQIVAISNNLKGVTLNPYLDIRPSSGI